MTTTVTTEGKRIPTDEQRAAVELFRDGDDMKIEAGAGTGKTSTLQLLGICAPELVGQYVAFNRSIADDAGGRMPGNVSARTVHSLAMSAVGRAYAHRLKSKRMRSGDIAHYLKLDGFKSSNGKELSPGFCGSLVMKTIRLFCQSADERPLHKHTPYVHGIDKPTAKGREWENNRRLRVHIAPAVDAAWDDLRQRFGYLTFRHEHYLKIWQLSHPKLPVDFLLVDEAQDTSPVMGAIYADQTELQRVYVGDSQQAIYEFMGAVNAMAEINPEHTAYLTRSFRFGDDIAAVANLLLARLDTPLRLSGTPDIGSEVRPFDEFPHAVLTRTNARSVTELLHGLRDGLRVHLIGGGSEVAAFARAAKDLKSGRRTNHPDLACFETWGEVQDYVESDPSGDELKLLVELIDEFGVDVILNALENQPPEKYADMVISTTHKAKGREWSHVRIAGDFAMIQDVEPAELRLAYVAATRAKLTLDDRMIRHMYVKKAD